MQSRAIYFTAPGQVEVRSQQVPDLSPSQVLVRACCSAISSGTESLVYQGLFPTQLTLDASLEALAGRFEYPLKYGYCVAGEVIAAAAGLENWVGRSVFAFRPHENLFLAAPESLLIIPEDLSPEEAVFLPNMETAVNFVMDGAPLIGEVAVVIGQGIVGLLTTFLLAAFPLAALLAVDLHPLRRQAALNLGATAALDPDDLLAALPAAGADLCFELSGSPAAIDTAIAAAGFDGRVVIGSWYGQKRAAPDLGGRFHRMRQRLVSSQVSTLAPHLTGRWDKARRFEVAWEMLRRIRPARLITHRFPLDRAPEAYHQLTEYPNETIQIVFTYENTDRE